MRRQNPVDIFAALWERINTSPWITLERFDRAYGLALNYEMKHSKTHAIQTFRLDECQFHTYTDTWTQRYVVDQLRARLTALTHNTVEAATGSLDVYREDYPA
jgi:hypothetical protein